MQNEIKNRQQLLDADGALQNPGWCRRNLYDYDRSRIHAGQYRLKEWDFYQISDGTRMVQLNFFNISLATCATFGYVDLKSGRKFDCMSVQLLTPHKNRPGLNGGRPNRLAYGHNGTRICFERGKNGGTLSFSGRCQGKPLQADFAYTLLPVHESITIATPFEQPGHFFYTNKINCMATGGSVTLGSEQFQFSPDQAFCVLDWGRGVWPHENMWYWANGSTRLPNGKLFGFELTWGFGDTAAATETALFYDGRCHKLGHVQLEQDPEIGDRWMEPWHFTEENGRLDLVMTPFYDNKTNLMPLQLFGMRTHQVHGLWNGTVVLDSGETLEIRNMYAFCEKVRNKW